MSKKNTLWTQNVAEAVWEIYGDDFAKAKSIAEEFIDREECGTEEELLADAEKVHEFIKSL